MISQDMSSHKSLFQDVRLDQVMSG